MIVTTLLRRLVDFFRRPTSGLAVTALFALAPKCVLCLAAYAGLGTALVGGPEICGGSSGAASSWLPWLLGLVAGINVVRWVNSRAQRRTVQSPAGKNDFAAS